MSALPAEQRLRAAEVLLAIDAIAAYTAGQHEMRRHPVAGLELADTLADMNDLADRVEDRAALGLAVGEVAHDVLDHHDSVIHQNADGEDQREQADPVDGEAQRVGREQRQKDGGRDDQRRGPG